jgi:hypothetical protein
MEERFRNAIEVKDDAPEEARKLTEEEQDCPQMIDVIMTRRSNQRSLGR